MERKSDHNLKTSAARIEWDFLDALTATRGHFVYESGHHGHLWLDLDRLLVDARRVREWAAELARRAAPSQPEVVCGPAFRGEL
jgi:orotate phosphoribosyltransferase